MQQLPKRIADLLAQGREWLALARQAEANVQRAREEAEKKAAADNFAGLFEAVRADLGEDLFQFAHILDRPPEWSSADRRAVVPIRVPGLTEIRALYHRPGDFPWRREGWDGWKPESELWEIVRWIKWPADADGPAELVEHNVPLRRQALCEALALAAEAEEERRRLQAEIDAEAQARKDEAREAATDKLRADLEEPFSFIGNTSKGPPVFQFGNQWLSQLAEALKPFLD